MSETNSTLPARCSNCLVAKFIGDTLQAGEVPLIQDESGPKIFRGLSPYERKELQAKLAACPGQIKKELNSIRGVMSLLRRQFRETLTHGGSYIDMDEGARVPGEDTTLEPGCPIPPREIDRIINNGIYQGDWQRNDGSAVGLEPVGIATDLLTAEQRASLLQPSHEPDAVRIASPEYREMLQFVIDSTERR